MSTKKKTHVTIHARKPLSRATRNALHEVAHRAAQVPLEEQIMFRLKRIEAQLEPKDQCAAEPPRPYRGESIGNAVMTAPAPPNVLQRLDILEKEFHGFRNDTLDKFQMLADRIGRIESVLGL